MDVLRQAVATVPAGAWLVGVSGGADSVALLHLLQDRRVQLADVQLHVVHLNHQTREVESDQDERFVIELADQFGLP